MKRSHPLRDKILSTFDGVQASKRLPELLTELLSEQKKSWPDLLQGCESLKRIKVKEIQCNGFFVSVQHNPGRIRSSTADVEKKSINGRPCFLCSDNLPDNQKGIFYRKEYLILCNPAPVFTYHFTVCHVDHLPQAIIGHADRFLQLAADLGSRWAVLYNGPKCGASAPDHLHFQVVPTGQMPIEKEFREEEKLNRIMRSGGVSLSRMRNRGRKVMILEGDDPMALVLAINKVSAALQKVLHIVEEPMMNITGSYNEGMWRLLIFPRAKHRPHAFFIEGDERIVISPAVMEMGGVLIAPMEKDFERLDAFIVEEMFREVSLDNKTMDSAIDAMAAM